MNKEMKDFMSSRKFWWIILTAVLVLMALLIIVNAIRGLDVSYIALAVFLLGALLSLIPQLKSKRFYNDLQNNPQLPLIQEDFRNAVPVRNGTLRLGRTWIFIKNKETLLTYAELSQIYQYIHKTNFVEDERKLIYVDKSGKKKTLCKLDVRGKSNDEMAKIVNFILAKNPYIKIGYR